MMMTFRTVTIASVAILVLSAIGCGEPDRAEYRDMAAEEVCYEADQCDNIGDLFGESYVDIDDCIVGERSRFNDMWPEDECGDDQIDPDAFDSCMDRATLAACGSGLDTLSAWEQCHRNNVCTN